MKKINVRYKKKRSKIGKLIRSKKVLVFFCLISIVFSCLMFNTNNSKAETSEQYNSFLYNEPIVPNNLLGYGSPPLDYYGDYWNLLDHNAENSNGMRNSFSAKEVIDNAQSHQFHGISYKTDSGVKTKYSIVQSYFDVNNNNSFRSPKIISGLYNNISVPSQNSDFTFSKGSNIKDGDLYYNDYDNKSILYGNSIYYVNYNAYYDNFNDASREGSWTDVLKATGYITEASNILTIGKSGVHDWWSGVYDAPYCTVSLSKFTTSNYGITVKCVSGTSTNNKQVLLLFQSESNVFWISKQSGDYINVAKIVSGTATDLTTVSSTDSYLRIVKIGTSYYFDSSANNITWTNRYTTSSLGITPVSCGLSQICWSGTSYDKTFDNFLMYENRSFSCKAIDFTSKIQYANQIEYKDTISSVKINLTDLTNKTLSNRYIFSVYNIQTKIFDVLNSSLNQNNYYTKEVYTLNSNQYNTTSRKIILRFQLNDTTYFSYYIDKLTLQITYNDYIDDWNSWIDYQVYYLAYDVSGNPIRYFNIYFTINKTGIFWNYGSKWYGYPSTAYSKNFNALNQTLDVKNIEIQTHIRYGHSALNSSYTLDLTSIKVNILLNYNISFLKDFYYEYPIAEVGGINTPAPYFDLQYIYCYYRCKVGGSQYHNYYQKSDLQNYFYSSYKGCRVLRADNNYIYNSFFEIPLFSDGIDLLEEKIYNDYTEAEMTEPEAPTGTYWKYTSFRLVYDYTQITTVGNWSVSFDMIEPKEYTAKFYYSERIIRNSAFGSWTIKISDDIKISFNWLRDGIVYVLNLVLLLLQYFLYLLTAAFSFILMFLGCYIVCFLYNICLYWIYIGICWIGWWIVVLLILCLNGLIWLWKNLIYPFLSWFLTTFMKEALTIFIAVWAFIITCLIWALTLGTIDFWDTYAVVNNMLTEIAVFLLDNILLVFDYLPTLLEALAFYILLVGLCYLKYIYCKARGFVKRAEALWDTFEVLIFPFVLIWKLIRAIYQSIPTAG